MDAACRTVIPLVTDDASVANVGGKAFSLARLAWAGFPVPTGFILSTEAYKLFIAQNEVRTPLQQSLTSLAAHDPASIASASSKIQSTFDQAPLPSDLAESIAQAYSALGAGEPAVAVRSSATAEDLADSSFAGQHDSYLNVRGEVALRRAVRRCWASLWTVRAIGYRQRMGIDQQRVAMAVVVQVMIRADVAGILFTANPTNGDRSELVINASFGLGEAVVGGHIAPDSFVLDRAELDLKQAMVSTKESMIVPDETQGITSREVPRAKREQPSLATGALRDLGTLALRAERFFDGQAQDIEWALADGTFWLLQSRPITNLPMMPLADATWDPPWPGTKWIRRQVVENMPEPLSPLFADLYLHQGLERSIDELMIDFGMPYDVTDFADRPMFATINGYAYCRASYRTTWRLMRIVPGIVYWYVTSFRKIVREAVPRWQNQALPAYLAIIEQWEAVDPAAASNEQLRSGVRSLAFADAIYWFNVAIVLGAAKITDALLNRFVRSRFVPGDLTSGVFLRGFPSKPLAAQQDLEAMAARIRAQETLFALVTNTPAERLCAALPSDPHGGSILNDLEDYFDQYGHQVYSLDFAQPTQREDPLPVLLGLKALVQSAGDPSAARRAVIARDRATQIERMSNSLGPLRRWLFRTLLRWALTYGPYREDALFYMGAAWPTLRRLALELGQRLVRAGTINIAEDVFYLDWNEIDRACGMHPDLAQTNLSELVVQRRQLREARKRLHPPAMVPQQSQFRLGPFDFSAFETQKRNKDDVTRLHGFAVSPGKVTGPASVIVTPADFSKMKPDTILVCPTTTPAWTPLFAQALGLATDIGGVLAHGSIVAREYGIPAVMGTGNLTRRIVSGQRITVDGDAGTVTILESTSRF